MSPNTPDIFDQWASAAQASAAVDAPEAAQAPPAPEPARATPSALRRAVQELLKHGLLERSAKPHLFRQIANDTACVDALLEPLDLTVRLDDHRGLAFVAIAATYQADGEDEDEWTHPLMRRQRLTLEQSLLLAILRREFLQREQESGLGVPVHLSVDSLLPQLEIYLGSTGSDMQESKRLLNLLEDLEAALHGAADEFVAKLAAHLRHEEEVLFPALLKAAPEAAPEIEGLEEEHRLLRVYATDLACRIRRKDTGGAYEGSRAFLAALFDHIDRERKAVDERLKSPTP